MPSLTLGYHLTPMNWRLSVLTEMRWLTVMALIFLAASTGQRLFILRAFPGCMSILRRPASSTVDFWCSIHDGAFDIGKGKDMETEKLSPSFRDDLSETKLLCPFCRGPVSSLEPMVRCEQCD